MNKRIGVILILVLMATFLAACNSTNLANTPVDDKVIDNTPNEPTESQQDNTDNDDNSVLIASAKTAAINEVNQYAIKNAPDVSVTSRNTIVGIISAYELLINEKTTLAEVDTTKTLCLRNIDLEILEDWKTKQLTAISVACDGNILNYQSLCEAGIEWSYYSDAQYNSDISYWDNIAAQAQVDYQVAVQRANQYDGAQRTALIKEADSTKAATLKQVTTGKKTADTKLQNRQTYEENKNQYDYWVGYKQGLIIGMNAEYNSRKLPIEKQIEILEK